MPQDYENENEDAVAEYSPLQLTVAGLESSLVYRPWFRVRAVFNKGVWAVFLNCPECREHGKFLFHAQCFSASDNQAKNQQNKFLAGQRAHSTKC